MIETPLTEEALRAAMQRIEDFIRVHREDDDVLPAFTVLRESLGITDEIMDKYCNWGEAITEEPASQSASMLLGLMMGLIAADHG